MSKLGRLLRRPSSDATRSGFRIVRVSPSVHTRFEKGLANLLANSDTPRAIDTLGRGATQRRLRRHGFQILTSQTLTFCFPVDNLLFEGMVRRPGTAFDPSNQDLLHVLDLRHIRDSAGPVGMG